MLYGQGELTVLYTILMGNANNNNGRVLSMEYGTAEETWKCEYIRERRLRLTFKSFTELLDYYGAIKLLAATFYKGRCPPAVQYNVMKKKCESIPPHTLI